MVSSYDLHSFSIVKLSLGVGFGINMIPIERDKFGGVLHSTNEVQIRTLAFLILRKLWANGGLAENHDLWARVFPLAATFEPISLNFFPKCSDCFLRLPRKTTVKLFRSR